jgi:PPP family 3-phenylpropionic acid transporter
MIGTAVASAASFQFFLIRFPEDSKLIIASVVSGVYVFFTNAFVPLADALVVHMLSTRPGATRELYGRQRLWGTVAYAIMSLIVGHIKNLKPAVNILIVGLTAIYIVCIIFVVKNPEREETTDIESKSEKDKEKNQPENKNNKSSMRTLLTNPNFLFLMLVVFLNGLARAVMTHFSEPIQRNVFKTPSHVTGYALLFSSFGEIVILFFAQQLLKHVGVRTMLLLGQATTVIRVCLYAFIPKSGSQYAPLYLDLFKGVSIAFIHIASLSWVSEIAPNDLRATALSIYSGIFTGISGFFAAILGWLIQNLQLSKDLVTEEQKLIEEVKRSIFLLQVTAYVSIAALILFLIKYIVVDEMIRKTRKTVQ